jgi:hypothetical protein
MKEKKGNIARVNIIDAKTGNIIQPNVMMQVEECKTIDQINKDLAKFFLPRRFELIEWIK